VILLIFLWEINKKIFKNLETNKFYKILFFRNFIWGNFFVASSFSFSEVFSLAWEQRGIVLGSWIWPFCLFPLHFSYFLVFFSLCCFALNRTFFFFSLHSAFFIHWSNFLVDPSSKAVSYRFPCSLPLLSKRVSEQYFEEFTNCDI